MLEWTFIKPSVFYLTYITDVMIIFGVINFIVKSAPLKTKTKDTDVEPDTSIFPREEGVSRINDTQSRRSDEESEVDGDALIADRMRMRSGSDSD